ncbi:MAG: hypothetical protein AB7N91_20245 [Candidatus Tectimicrobiota bacterium]
MDPQSSDAELLQDIGLIRLPVEHARQASRCADFLGITLEELVRKAILSALRSFQYDPILRPVPTNLGPQSVPGGQASSGPLRVSPTEAGLAGNAAPATTRLRQTALPTTAAGQVCSFNQQRKTSATLHA